VILTCECPSPAHCLEAAGGEQGLSADELEIVRLRRERDEARAETAKLRRDLGDVLAARDEALTRCHAEVTVALRDLVNSVEAIKCRDTIVLRDLEAARALLGEGRS
jgi:hypothetical protein